VAYIRGVKQRQVVEAKHPVRSISSAGSHDGELAIALRCLAHPSSIAALALLALNDHMWKGVGPAWLTGKLSDLAGLFYFPFLVAAACALLPPASARASLSRGRLAFGAVAVWFAAAKTIPAAHHATVWFAAHLVGPVDVVRDPTDAIALVALLPAWRLYRRIAAAPAPAIRAVQVPVVFLAALLSAATSRPREPSVDKLVVRQGTLFAVVGDVPSGDGQDAVNWTAFATIDGMNWVVSELPRSAVDGHEQRLALDVAGARLHLRRHELFARRDGRDELVWAIPAGREEFMAMAGGRSWWMMDVAVVPGTSRAVVALGSEGVLVGEGRSWTRVAVGPAGPTDTLTTPRLALGMLASGQWIFAASAALLAAVLSSLLSWLVPRPRQAPHARARAPGRVAALRSALRRRAAAIASVRLDLGCAAAAAIALALAGLVFGLAHRLARPSWFVLPGELLAVAGPLCVAAGVLALGWLRHARACHERGVRIRAPIWRLLGAAALGGLFAGAAVWAWDIGWVDTLRNATALATIGIVGSALLLHRGKRNS
jgi:hypothetical protein